jgi:hypothetical protein
MEKPWSVFIPSGRFLKTKIGSVQAAFDREAGGAFCFGSDGNENGISIGTRVRLDCTHSEGAGERSSARFGGRGYLFRQTQVGPSH